MRIDWQSPESLILGPNLQDQKLELKSLSQYPAHIWLPTSGTTQKAKFVGISKVAILESAKHVNAWLEVTVSDVMMRSLPLHHIGGLSVLARAHLAGAVVVEYENKWNPQKFVSELNEKNVSIVSLVPTQLYDLCKLSLPAPAQLRVALVGGGHLTSEAYTKAVQLGWPILPTYGMSECGSQIATGALDQIGNESIPEMCLLPHWEVKTENKQLFVRGAALLSAYAFLTPDKKLEIVDPKIHHWFATRDLIEISERGLKFLGRIDDCFKIGGRLVNLSKLQSQWEELGGPMGSQILATPSERLEYQVSLMHEGLNLNQLSLVLKSFNEAVSNNSEKIRDVYLVDSIPKGQSSKFSRSIALKQIGFNPK